MVGLIGRLWNLPNKSIVKEASGKTLAVAKFFCVLHVTNTYLCTFALVKHFPLNFTKQHVLERNDNKNERLQAYGPSMIPTFNLTGDMFLAERLSIKFGKVGPGDIVLIRSPESPRKVMVKRLLGLESHSVTYVVDPMNSDRCDTIVVPKGHVWVEGDNIYNSRDSRQFGPVPYSLLEGKVFCKIWPPKEFGSLMKSGMKDPDL